MKRLLLTLAVALVSVSSSAAIQYEFTQKSTVSDSVEPVADLTARAIVDGERSRIDFLGGTVYPPGTYVVSTDGSRKLRFVDPQNEWFTEVDTATLATSLGASSIKITNLKSEMEPKDDQPVIAGFPTQHTRLTVTYDITVTKKSIPLKQHVRTEIDTWSTPRFQATGASSFLSGIRTGNPDIDNLLEVELQQAKGFPLRQTVTTRTIADLPPSRSALSTPTTRTLVREMWVTKIQETAPDASQFVVPAKYRRADVTDTPAAARQTVTFDPPTQ